MSDLSNLRFFAAHPQKCSYLPDEESTTIFVDPEAQIDISIYESLSNYGFRRSGNHLYRPQCLHCQACIPIRIPTAIFTPSRAQKRCLNKNADLDFKIRSSIDDDECYALYEQYIAQRHADGDMYPASRKQYQEFLSSEWGTTQYLEFRDKGQLLAVAVCDTLDKSASAIYSFYAPGENKRGLGNYCILFQILRAKQLKLPYIYLGYWIKNCRKMNYKTAFKPFQILTNNTWVTVA